MADILPTKAGEEAPEWLLVMRAMTGLVETPGSSDNPKIMAMAEEIGRTYPEMASYCRLYQHDATPWCGLAAAYCTTMAGVRPPFGPTDTDKFLWARAWDHAAGYQQLTFPVLGCIVVLGREGGGHVTLYESTAGDYYRCRGGNQADSVNLASFPISNVIKLMWPKDAGPLPPQPRRELKKGMNGADVAELQLILGIPSDGDFGPMTEAQVKSFQAACGLVADGVVGDLTWDEVEDLEERMKDGYSGLSDEITTAVAALAEKSDLANYSWEERGRAPPGYVQGMALAFALAVTRLEKGDSSAIAMAKADTGDENKDALTWYRTQFKALGMDNSTSGVDTLRHLFVMLYGLGMRESSGQYCEGRDMSASNITADSCEAGLFQTSWDIQPASPEFRKLIELYWDDPNGFLPAFSQGVTPSATDLQGYGSGEGATYQWLAKYSPAFACMTTAVGLRVLRKHWGPINRREVDLVSLTDDLFKAVQELLEDRVPPEPIEPPDPDMKITTVDIVSDTDVMVTINGVVITGG